MSAKAIIPDYPGRTLESPEQMTKRLREFVDGAHVLILRESLRRAEPPLELPQVILEMLKAASPTRIVCTEDSVRISTNSVEGEKL